MHKADILRKGLNKNKLVFFLKSYFLALVVSFSEERDMVRERKREKKRGRKRENERKRERERKKEDKKLDLAEGTKQTCLLVVKRSS